jgi:hypothetical protein
MVLQRRNTGRIAESFIAKPGGESGIEFDGAKG